jgi:pre-mRNA-processing factor SLU7
LDAAAASATLMKDNLAAREAQMEAQKKEEEEAAARDAAEGATKKKNPFEVKKDVWGGDVAEDVQLDPAKLMDALKREEARDRGDGEDGGDERKRGYNVSHDVDVTEEDMEAYRMKRQRKDDPMAAPDAGTDGYDMV